MSFPNNKKPVTPSGFTLIELVVVVGILAIVGVMIIPTVRTLNEDRKIRDTARVVGSVFAAARERAAVDGRAGVEIVSVPSNPGGPNRIPPEALRYNLPNMGLVLYQLRSVSPYPGDTAGHSAVITVITLPVNENSPGTATVNFQVDLTGSGVPLPLSIEAGVGDFLELGISGVQYVITGGGPSQDIEIELPFYVPVPPNDVSAAPTGIALPFKVHRKPVRIESSAVRLPNNLFLNMALSGHGVAPTIVANTENQWQGRQFRDFDDPLMPFTEGSTQFWFAADGSVSYVRSRGFIPMPGPATYPSAMQKPFGPIHILMCSGSGDDVDLTNLDSAAFLQDDNNMWITINHRTGGVTMGKLAQIDPVITATNTLRTQIDASRQLARNRRSATP